MNVITDAVEQQKYPVEDVLGEKEPVDKERDLSHAGDVK